MKTTLPLGSISTGTLRAEDLISALLAVLRPTEIRLTKTERASVSTIDRTFQKWLEHEPNEWESPGVGAHLPDQGDWCMEEAVSELVDIANAHCPDYCFVGAHPGDGADLGVWPADEVFEVTRPGGYDGCIGYGDTAPDNRDLTHWLKGDDHGNATMYRRAGTRWIECWRCWVPFPPCLSGKELLEHVYQWSNRKRVTK